MSSKSELVDEHIIKRDLTPLHSILYEMVPCKNGKIRLDDAFRQLLQQRDILEHELKESEHEIAVKEQMISDGNIKINVLMEKLDAACSRIQELDDDCERIRQEKVAIECENEWLTGQI